MMYKHTKQKVATRKKNEGKVENIQIQNIANQRQLVEKINEERKTLLINSLLLLHLLRLILIQDQQERTWHFLGLILSEQFFYFLKF